MSSWVLVHPCSARPLSLFVIQLACSATNCRTKAEVHADKENGRITLSTKEFEDDDHVGETLFGDRCSGASPNGESPTSLSLSLR